MGCLNLPTSACGKGRWPAQVGQDAHGMRDAVGLEGSQACGQRILGQQVHSWGFMMPQVNSEWFAIEIRWDWWNMHCNPISWISYMDASAFCIMDACFGLQEQGANYRALSKTWRPSAWSVRNCEHHLSTLCWAIHLPSCGASWPCTGYIMSSYLHQITHRCWKCWHSINMKDDWVTSINIINASHLQHPAKTQLRASWSSQFCLAPETPKPKFECFIWKHVHSIQFYPRQIWWFNIANWNVTAFLNRYMIRDWQCSIAK